MIYVSLFFSLKRRDIFRDSAASPATSRGVLSSTIFLSLHKHFCKLAWYKKYIILKTEAIGRKCQNVKISAADIFPNYIMFANKSYLGDEESVTENV